MSAYDDLLSAIQCQVTRVKVTATVVGPRVLAQSSGLAGEVRTGVELLHPYGYSARPPAGSDAVQLQVLGDYGHAVLLGGDAVGGAIADLADGEVGLRTHGSQIVLRSGGVQILMDGETLRKLVTDAFLPFYNQHTHPTPNGESGAPSVPMTAEHLTTTAQIGGAA